MLELPSIIFFVSLIVFCLWVNVLVIEESPPLATDVVCARGAGEQAECMVLNRAVLTARIQKVSALRERGRWM